MEVLLSTLWRRAERDWGFKRTKAVNTRLARGSDFYLAEQEYGALLGRRAPFWAEDNHTKTLWTGPQAYRWIQMSGSKVRSP